jgi:hypothetical protein
MADEYTTLVTSPNDVEVGEEVKVLPSNAMLVGLPPFMQPPMDPKMGTVKSKKNKVVVVDVGDGFDIKITVPSNEEREFFKWDIYKKKVGGRRRKGTRRHKKARHTRRR